MSSKIMSPIRFGIVMKQVPKQDAMEEDMFQQR
jgi:hypothetical protein